MDYYNAYSHTSVYGKLWPDEVFQSDITLFGLYYLKLNLFQCFCVVMKINIPNIPHWECPDCTGMEFQGKSPSHVFVLYLQ